MPKLSDTVLVILSNAAKRDERVIFPLPKSLKGGVKSATPILKDLLKKKLIVEQTATASMPNWREEGDNRFTLVITDAGMTAIGLGKGDDSPKPAKGLKKATAAKPAGKASKRGQKPARDKAPGTSKIDLLKTMLGSKSGMTVPEASKATGWLMHSVRGVMSGVLKKKLGLKIDSQKVEGRGRVYRLA
jgi:hypothetical protein